MNRGIDRLRSGSGIELPEAVTDLLHLPHGGGGGAGDAHRPNLWWEGFGDLGGIGDEVGVGVGLQGGVVESAE